MKPHGTLRPSTYSRIQELGDDFIRFILAINSEWRENYNLRLVFFFFILAIFPPSYKKERWESRFTSTRRTGSPGFALPPASPAEYRFAVSFCTRTAARAVSSLLRCFLAAICAVPDDQFLDFDQPGHERRLGPQDAGHQGTQRSGVARSAELCERPGPLAFSRQDSLFLAV